MHTVPKNNPNVRTKQTYVADATVRVQYLSGLCKHMYNCTSGRETLHIRIQYCCICSNVDRFDFYANINTKQATVLPGPVSTFSLAPTHQISTFVGKRLKGIVSRDFEGLQMILMDRIGVPDVPLEVYSF